MKLGGGGSSVGSALGCNLWGPGVDSRSPLLHGRFSPFASLPWSKAVLISLTSAEIQDVKKSNSPSTVFSTMSRKSKCLIGGGVRKIANVSFKNKLKSCTNCDEKMPEKVVNNVLDIVPKFQVLWFKWVRQNSEKWTVFPDERHSVRCATQLWRVYSRKVMHGLVAKTYKFPAKYLLRNKGLDFFFMKCQLSWHDVLTTEANMSSGIYLNRVLGSRTKHLHNKLLTPVFRKLVIFFK